MPHARLGVTVGRFRQSVGRRGVSGGAEASQRKASDPLSTDSDAHWRWRGSDLPDKARLRQVRARGWCARGLRRDEQQQVNPLIRGTVPGTGLDEHETGAGFIALGRC